MKLLYITNGVAGSGGLERVLSTKTKFLIDKHNYHISIITLNESKHNNFFTFHERITFYNIDLTCTNKIKWLFYYISEVNRIIRIAKPDVILVCDDGLKGLYAPLWLKTSAKLIYERHAALQFNSKSRLVQKIMRQGPRVYDVFVVLTPSCKKDWGGHSNIQVIPNPLDSLPFEHSSLNHGRVICVGSISFNKGYDLLIDALSQVSHLEWHIDIYGKGNPAYLTDKARKLGIPSKRLKFKGVSNNIEDEYLTADFLILPSRSEGFGMVLIEAMAYGLPCIAFDCPNGPRHIIQDNINGFLVEPENPNALAAAIERMLKLSTTEKENFSNNALEKSHSYNIKNIGSQWNTLFQSLKINL